MMLSGDTDPMDNKVHFRLPVAARFRPVQFHSCPNTGAYAPKGYSGAIRPQFRTGRKQQRVHHFYDNRYYRLLHHPTVSNWIIQAGGMGNMSRNINSTASKTGSGVGAVAGAATGNAGGRVGGKLIKGN